MAEGDEDGGCFATGVLEGWSGGGGCTGTGGSGGCSATWAEECFVYRGGRPEYFAGMLWESGGEDAEPGCAGGEGCEVRQGLLPVSAVLAFKDFVDDGDGAGYYEDL